jgi:filamentous hemagglutinin
VRAAVSEASFATTQAQLAKASGDLAEAMKAVGLDSWPRFVVDAQARARDPATVAAIEKSLQPPDLKRDAITPVYPVEKALAVGAAAVTGGAAGLVGGLARAIGGAVASKILGDNPAASGGAPTQSPATPEVWTVPKDVTEKIPPEWGRGRPNNKGVGLRWEDPKNSGNGVRIDKGDPKATFVSQRTDHVVVMKCW